MFYTLIYLAFCGFPLPNEVNYDLLQFARKLYKKGGRSLKFKTDSSEGMIFTGHETCGVGSMFGIRFTAEVDTNRGSTKADFLISEDVLTLEADIDEKDLIHISLPPSSGKGTRHPAETAAWN